MLHAGATRDGGGSDGRIEARVRPGLRPPRSLPPDSPVSESCDDSRPGAMHLRPASPNQGSVNKVPLPVELRVSLNLEAKF